MRGHVSIRARGSSGRGVRGRAYEHTSACNVREWWRNRKHGVGRDKQTRGLQIRLNLPQTKVRL